MIVVGSAVSSSPVAAVECQRVSDCSFLKPGRSPTPWTEAAHLPLSARTSTLQAFAASGFRRENQAFSHRC